MLYQERWKKIIAIVPQYELSGRTATRIYYEDGTIEEYRCRSERIVRDLAEQFGTTFERAREWSTTVVGKGGQRKPPLVFHEHFCLVQVKCRPQNSHNSGTIGYLALHKVRNVLAQGVGCRVYFHTSTVPLDILQKRRSVMEQLQQARNLVRLYQMMQRGEWMPQVKEH
jgi:hypothetical protein